MSKLSLETAMRCYVSLTFTQFSCVPCYTCTCETINTLCAGSSILALIRNALINVGCNYWKREVRNNFSFSKKFKKCASVNPREQFAKMVSELLWNDVWNPLFLFPRLREIKRLHFIFTGIIANSAQKLVFNNIPHKINKKTRLMKTEKNRSTIDVIIDQTMLWSSVLTI